MAFNLTAQEEAQLKAAFAALESDLGPAIAAQGVDPREIFCRYWPVVKQVLEFLKGLPLPVKGAIALVIAAGDAAAKVICR